MRQSLTYHIVLASNVLYEMRVRGARSVVRKVLFLFTEPVWAMDRTWRLRAL